MHGVSQEYVQKLNGEVIEQFTDPDEFDFNVDLSDVDCHLLKIEWVANFDVADEIQIRLNGLAQSNYDYTNIVTGDSPAELQTSWKLAETHQSDYSVSSGTCYVQVYNPYSSWDAFRPTFRSEGMCPQVGANTFFTGEYDAGIEPTSVQLFIDSPIDVDDRARVKFSAVRL